MVRASVNLFNNSLAAFCWLELDLHPIRDSRVASLKVTISPHPHWSFSCLRCITNIHQSQKASEVHNKLILSLHIKHLTDYYIVKSKLRFRTLTVWVIIILCHLCLTDGVPNSCLHFLFQWGPIWRNAIQYSKHFIVRIQNAKDALWSFVYIHCYTTKHILCILDTSLRQLRTQRWRPTLKNIVPYHY